MKKILASILGVFLSFSAMAVDELVPPPAPITSGNSAQQQQGQQQSSASGATSVNAGNNQYVIFNGPEKSVSEAKVTYGGTQTLKNVPSVSGSALISSNDTCMGSTSGSVNVAGFGGSYGTTWTDDNCVMLKNSREMWNMGFKAAAFARMCMDDLNREAFELTDMQCPEKKEKRKSVEKPEITDPIVRQRIGLKPLE